MSHGTLYLSSGNGVDIKQAIKPLTLAEKHIRLKAHIRRQLSDIAQEIIEAMDADDRVYASQIWNENKEWHDYLWLAESKGGYFTQAEKEWLRSADGSDKRGENDEQP